MNTEIDRERKEKERQEDLERLKRFVPMDDTFMRRMFKDNIPLAEMVLRIILDKDDLIITHCETQADMKRVTGARSICLDAYGTDSNGNKYDIEVQMESKGASPKRARYYSSVLDIENLDASDDFEKLPETYVIFITGDDIYGAGLPLYNIESKICELNISFNDKRHIIYVNGSYRNDDAIGHLMHDFNCNVPEDMHYSLMAERTDYLKNNPKGVEEMCKIMEEIESRGFEKGIEKGKIEEKKQIALKMYAKGVSLEEIADIVEYDIAQIQKWIA